MAGVISNLVYRVSVSAIVGAIVAGGLIYLNNERIVKNSQNIQTAQTEQLAEMNVTLTEAIESLRLETEARDAALVAQIEALSAKIDSMPVAEPVSIPKAEPVDFSEILAAISAASDTTAAQIAELEAALAAQTQEQ